MTDLEWLIMAGERAKELPDMSLDWKWCRVEDDKVVFAHTQHSPMLGDKDGLRFIELTPRA